MKVKNIIKLIALIIIIAIIINIFKSNSSDILNENVNDNQDLIEKVLDFSNDKYYIPINIYDNNKIELNLDGELIFGEDTTLTIYLQEKSYSHYSTISSKTIEPNKCIYCLKANYNINPNNKYRFLITINDMNNQIISIKMQLKYLKNINYPTK